MFWVHPRAGGELRRKIIDDLHEYLSTNRSLIQVVVGPRQVGKTTAVKHLIHEWQEGTHYASADAIVAGSWDWIEDHWQKALHKGEGSLLVLDEIQKVPNWTEKVKDLWERSKDKNLKVVVLGSTSLEHFLDCKTSESLSGRFISHHLPHWSFLETQETFGTTIDDYSRFGGYPKAMEYVNDLDKWTNYIGASVLNRIIDVDIYQQGKFTKIDHLRRAFTVFCQEASNEINYSKLLSQIQSTGNNDTVKKYLDGFFNTFLMQPVPRIDNDGNFNTVKNPKLILNCPAVYSFGRGQTQSVNQDMSQEIALFHQSIASELSRVPHKSFGYWKNEMGSGMDLFIKTKDNKIFGVYLEHDEKPKNSNKGYDAFRKNFPSARVARISVDDYPNFVKGQRSFLESSSL